MQEINPHDVRLVAMNLLARREHLRAELAVKLNKRFEDESLVETTLDELVEENLLSDHRFTESYIHHRAKKGYGPDRIRAELRQKGAPGELVSLALEDTETDWATLAREVRHKKFGDAEPSDFKEKSRQLRFLQYRGFGGEYSSLAFLDD
jgi:regulatory protein